MRKKKNGFTLIEVIVSLVIIAIVAVIAIPIVVSIIGRIKMNALKRSVDGYGRSIENGIAGFLMENGHYPTSIAQLTIEYSGKEVRCVD